MSIHYTGQYGNLRYDCRNAQTSLAYHNVGKASLANLSMICSGGPSSHALEPASAGIKPQRRWRTSKKNENAWTSNWKQRVGRRARYDAEERNGNTESSNPKIDLSPANWSCRWETELKVSLRRGTRVCGFRQTQASASTLSTEEREAIRSLSKTFQPCGMVSTTTSTDRQAHRAFVARTSRRQRARGIRVRPCYVAVGQRGFTTQHEFIRSCSSLRSNRGLCPDG